MTLDSTPRPSPAAAARFRPLADLSPLAPIAAAMAYPALLRGAYSSLARYAGPGGWSDRAGDLCLFATATMGSYAVPLLALCLARRVAGRPVSSAASQRLLRVTHLAFAAPPLYTLIGVLTTLLHAGGLDIVVWVALWGAIAAYVAHAPREARVGIPRAVPSLLRSVHGTVAMAVILAFLAAHLANHVLALWTPQLHGRVMRTLEIWYRNRAVEPALLVLIACLVVSGLALAWRQAGCIPQGGFRTVQTLTGFYVGIFIVSHLSAAFLLARWEEQIPTNWAWASGAPAGILSNPWNIRLLPHYSIAVWAVITHAGLGLRQVMQAHGVATRRADRVAYGTSMLGAVLSLLISSALLGLHIGTNPHAAWLRAIHRQWSLIMTLSQDERSEQVSRLLAGAAKTISAVRYGSLVTVADSGCLNARPMGRLQTDLEADDWKIQLVADGRSRKALDIRRSGKAAAIFQNGNEVFVSVSGTPALHHDLSDARRLLKSAFEAYFPTEQDRANAVVIEIDAHHMELWIRGITPEACGLHPTKLERGADRAWGLIPYGA